MNRTDAIKWLKATVYVGIYGGLLVPLVFVPVVIFPFVFSKLIYFQILIGLTFPAYLALAWAEPKYRPRWVPMYGAVFAYFVALALSVIFAVDVSRAWWGNQERMNGLFTLLHFFAWFTMTASVLTSWKQWRRILMFEAVLSAIMACVSLLQIPFPRLLLFPVTNRPGGFVDNPIYMAAYQIFNFFFIALLWLKGVSKSTKIWLALFFVLDLGAFLVAQSRGALVGLFAGIVVFALAYALMSPGKKTKMTVLGAATVAFLLYGAIFALRNTSLIQGTPLERLTNFQVTTETRFIAWKIAWSGFLERPLTGWGLDDFHILFNLKYNPKSLEYGYYETWFDRAHNTVLDTLSMTGIMGFITFFGIFAALFWSVIRAYRKHWIDPQVAGILMGLPVAYFVQNLFVFDQPAGFTMSFFMFALVASATAAQFTGVKDEGVEEVLTPEGRPVPWFAFGGLMICGAVLVWRFSVLPWTASTTSISSNNFFSAGNYAQAYALAKKASTIPTPYLDEQTFLQSRNLISLVDAGTIQKFPQWKDWYQLIKDTNARYLSEHPQNTNPIFVYARFLNSFARFMPEDRVLAEQQYKRALETSPQRQQLLYSLARFYIESGRKQDGYDAFKRAVDANPNVGESHWYVGLSLMFDLGKREEGAKEMVASMNASSPYQLKDVREAAAMAMAYDVLNDKEGMTKLIDVLATLPAGDLGMYIDIARLTEHQGLIDQRNRILGALERMSPQLAMRLAPLTNGTATSIDGSLKLTENLVSTTTSAAPVQTPSAASSGPGPRRK